jgi:hypothetical protein
VNMAPALKMAPKSPSKMLGLLRSMSPNANAGHFLPYGTGAPM